MSENPSHNEPESTTKPNRINIFYPSIKTLSIFLISLCFVLCFFFLDYRQISEGFTGIKLNGSGLIERNSEFTSEKGVGCDVFNGDWVWDEKNYPLYKSKECNFLDFGFRCNENGRPDDLYTKWRWQPKACNLPRFDARLMLEKLRNKRVAFVGDSIGRNQWESLLCLLSLGVANKSSIYEVNGNPITKHKGYLVFKFDEYNCTVEYYRVPFLVRTSRPPLGAPPRVRTILKLDQLNWSYLKWRSADVLVFNTGHWWNDDKTIKGGCYFEEGGDVKMKMKPETAYYKALDTVVKWIHREINPNKTQVFFRTYAPVHFRAGDWRTGGSCDTETLPDIGSTLVPPHTWDLHSTIYDVLSSHSNLTFTNSIDILDITKMSSRRKDGHSSIYYLGPVGPAAINRQDCSHWCLPGVPDAWNELLYALFMKHESAQK